jgi:hypothetical protein
MKDLLLFVLAILINFSLAYVSSRILKILFPAPSSESATVQRSTKITAGFMTIFSLAAMYLFNQPALALPGVYVGLVVSMILGGGGHSPKDPYSWILIAAPINFFLYYWLVRIVAKFFPSVLEPA